MEFWFRKIFPRTPKFFIKSILNYFIGNYLCDELTEDQIEIIDDYAECRKIFINVKVINDTFEKQNIPISLLYGFVGRIRIYLPWRKQDGKLLFEINELELNFGPTLRSSTPDPDLVFGSMVDSVLNMQRSFQEDDFSGIFMYEEQQKGKNFNALLSKWISKLCLRFNKTRISFESLPIQQIDKCCRFLCQIKLIDFASKESDCVNYDTSTLLGILLRNNIEVSGIKVMWEVASLRNDSLIVDSKSINKQPSNTLYSCQILSVSNVIRINYTLILSNPEPLFEIHFDVDTIHVWLAPLPFHWIEVLLSQCAPREYDPSISKNVKMTQSQFESFFTMDDRATSFKSQAQESIYYDLDFQTDSFSNQNVTYDEVSLDNSDNDDDERCSEFPNDNSTCVSVASNLTLFDEDGKMNTNFKAQIMIKTICMKLLLQNPQNELECFDYRDVGFERDNDKWKTTSQKHFGFIKTNKDVLTYETMQKIFSDSGGNLSYFSIYMTNIQLAASTKKYSDKYIKLFQFNADDFYCTETLYTPYGAEPTLQIAAIQPDPNSSSSAINIKIEYSSLLKQLSFIVTLGKCYIGIDISMQDRLRPLLQNDIIEYTKVDKTSCYELNRSNRANFQFGSNIVVNISNLTIQVYVPIVNLNDDIRSKSYWQYRRLHRESLLLHMTSTRILIKLPINKSKENSLMNHIDAHLDLYTKCVLVSLVLGGDKQNLEIDILNIISDSDDPTMEITLRSQTLKHIDETELTSIGNFNDDSFPYIPYKRAKKGLNKPYKTKESARNNSSSKTINTPSDDISLNNYIKKSKANSYFDMEVKASSIIMLITDKDILEIIYHRLAFDFVLWEPSYDKRNNDVLFNYKSRETLETDEDTNTDTSFDDEINYSIPKSTCQFKKKKFTLSVTCASARGYLQTNSDTITSECVIDVHGMSLFTDSDIVQGLIETQTMLIMKVEELRIFHNDNIQPTPEDKKKLFDKFYTLNSGYYCVVDILPKHLKDISLPTDNNCMLVLIMDSQISKLKRMKANVKQKASAIVTAKLNYCCLRHKYFNDVNSGLKWLINLTSLLSLNNPVITGYTLPDADTVLHLHASNCALDLSFSQYPMLALSVFKNIEIEMSLNTTESYCLNSEVCFNGAQIFIKPNDVCLLNKYNQWDNRDWFPSSILDLGYVFVADFENLDTKFTKIGSTNSTDKTPSCNLEITNSGMSVHFCADSLNLLISCIAQLTAKSDSDADHQHHTSSKLTVKQSKEYLDESQKWQFNHMISDAMKEDKGTISKEKETDDEFTDDFLLIDDIFSKNHDNIVSLEGNANPRLSVVHDHYKNSTNEDRYSKMKRAIFRDPDGFPTSENSLVVHDFSLCINVYAGSDLDEKRNFKPLQGCFSKPKLRPNMNVPIKFQRFPTDSKSEITIQSSDFAPYFGEQTPNSFVTRGGSNRKLKECYQWSISKINFRYSNFCRINWRNVSFQQQISRRLVLMVNSVEMMSRNMNSKINKVLFCDSNATNWYDPKSPMVNLKIIFFQSNPDHDVVNEECDIKISVQPIRLNIDQELVTFVQNFYENVNTKELFTGTLTDSRHRRASVPSNLCESPHQEKDSILIPPNHNSFKELTLGRGGGIDSIAGSSPLSRASTIRAPAFDEMRKTKLIDEDDGTENSFNTSKSNLTVFIRRFDMYPDLSIRLDYTGTRLDLSQGAIKGLLYIIMQLNNVVFIIKSKQYVEGITGLEVLLQILIKEISEEIYSQLKSVVVKVGPMSEISEIFSGIYDFFSMPYHYYRNEFGIFEGIKLGTRSITTTSLWAALTLLSKGLKLFQKMAETTYDLVSPEPPLHDEDESLHSARDFREGLTNAAYGVRRRFRNTAHEFQNALSRSDRPLVGRLGDVIRHVPPAIASPIVATCEATNQLVDGLRYQLKPEMKAEDEKKWKQH